MQLCQCALLTGCTCRLLQSSTALTCHRRPSVMKEGAFLVCQLPQHSPTTSMMSDAVQSQPLQRVCYSYAGHPGHIPIRSHLSRIAAIRDVTYPGL